MTDHDPSAELVGRIRDQVAHTPPSLLRGDPDTAEAIADAHRKLAGDDRRTGPPDRRVPNAMLQLRRALAQRAILAELDGGPSDLVDAFEAIRQALGDAGELARFLDETERLAVRSEAPCPGCGAQPWGAFCPDGCQDHDDERTAR